MNWPEWEGTWGWPCLGQGPGRSLRKSPDRGRGQGALAAVPRDTGLLGGYPSMCRWGECQGYRAGNLTENQHPITCPGPFQRAAYRRTCSNLSQSVLQTEPKVTIHVAEAGSAGVYPPRCAIYDMHVLLHVTFQRKVIYLCLFFFFLARKMSKGVQAAQRKNGSPAICMPHQILIIYSPCLLPTLDGTAPREGFVRGAFGGKKTSNTATTNCMVWHKLC